jgi:thiosulfate/3-mercaptopyruvate sulfurtransferase
MRIKLVSLMACAVLLRAAAPVCGGHGDRASMIVSTAWLAEHGKDSGLVILSVGQKQDYDAGHIPGALFLDYTDIRTMAPAGQEPNVELPPMAQLKDVFEKLGVNNDSHIILYVAKDQLTLTTRAFLTLDAMGFGARASILDGGFPLWQKEGRAITKDVRPVTRGKLDVCPQNDVIASRDYVRDNLHHPGVDIVDGRTAEFYTGTRIPQGQRAGHIPGASNLPYSTLVDADGKWRSADELRKQMEDVGIKPGDRVVSYCHIGQQATVVYFVARYLGMDARLYDGSWEDWSAHTDLPAEISK